jgi:hypothetical protein
MKNSKKAFHALPGPIQALVYLIVVGTYKKAPFICWLPISVRGGDGQSA